MNMILIGNVVTFIGALFMIGIGLVKKKNHILAAQCMQFGFMGAGNFILGGYTGAIVNLISILRNVICLKVEFTWPLKIIFILIQAGLSYAVNDRGLIGWLPIVAVVLFTCFLDTKNEIVLKLVIIAAQLMWSIYDASINNYTALIMDVITIITTAIGIFMVKKSRENGNA